MKFDGVSGKLEKRKCFQRQSFTKYLMQTNFHVKKCTMGKVQFLFFQEFFASTDKIFILWGGLSTRQ